MSIVFFSSGTSFRFRSHKSHKDIENEDTKKFNVINLSTDLRPQPKKMPLIYETINDTTFEWIKTINPYNLHNSK